MVDRKKSQGLRLKARVLYGRGHGIGFAESIPPALSSPLRVFYSTKIDLEATAMNADVDYQAVLADLKERREKIDSAIQAVESILASLGPGSGTARVRGSQDIAVDAFLGLTIAEAAVSYLTKVRTAQSVAQIWEAIKKGGLPHTKYNAVYNALNRRELQEGDDSERYKPHCT
jgi:hypothetical protein